MKPINQMNDEELTEVWADLECRSILTYQKLHLLRQVIAELDSRYFASKQVQAIIPDDFEQNSK